MHTCRAACHTACMIVSSDGKSKGWMMNNDDLLELYAANFNVNGTALCSLVDSIEIYGSVDDGVDYFVSDEFLDDMRG